jgi:hypothetical protein
MKGYTADQLADYILRQLGSPVWIVEMTRQQVLDCIQDALTMWNIYRPVLTVTSVRLVNSNHVYLDGEELGDGPIRVDFVEPLPAPTSILYGNLIDPAPLFKTGLDEYDTFLRWRKTWLRVTSIVCDWWYDRDNKRLLIHNPVSRYHASVFWFKPYANVSLLPLTGSQWVKEYALEKSRYVYGEVLAKYSGAIPGPAQSLTLDQQKRTAAAEKITKLEEKLKAMMELAPLVFD